MVAPEALLIKRGVPPTPRNARTGEFTPPGINSNARAKSASDRVTFFVELMRAFYDRRLRKRIVLFTGPGAVAIESRLV
jgi:hypothetical protein